MDSPVRQQQKRNDYLRHKMFRKINRRRRAKRQLEIEAPVKELKKRLRLKRTFEDGKDGQELPYPLRTSKDYDDNLAYQSGLTRDPKTGHMMSTTQEEYPKERTYLKTPLHPTYSLAVWGDKLGGYDVYNRNGKTYSAPTFSELMYTKSPFKYAGGKDDNIANDDVNKVVEAGKEIVTGAVPFYGTYQDIKTAINEPSLSNISWALASAVSDGLLLSGIGSGLGILGKSLRATRGVSNAVRAVRDANRSYQLAKRGVTDVVTYNAKRNAVNQSLKKAAKKIVQSQELDLGTEALEWGYKNDNNKWKPTFNFANGKDSGIHIKPLNRGKFTRLKQRTGHSTAWFKAHGTPAQKKMATFALNAKKWHH